MSPAQALRDAIVMMARAGVEPLVITLDHESYDRVISDPWITEQLVRDPTLKSQGTTMCGVLIESVRRP